MSTSLSSLSAPAPPPVVPRTGPWLVGGVGAMALLVVAGWFLVVSPQRSAMADTDDSIVAAQSNADLLTTRVAQLEQQYASLPELQAQLASLQVQMPGDAALPELVRSLRAAAASTGAELTTLTPQAPTAFGGEAVAAPASQTATDGTAAGAADGSTGTGTTPAPATAESTATAGAAADGLLQVPVTISATGSYAALQGFLAAVQQQQRLLLVTSTSFAPGGGATSTDLTLTVTGNVFVLPSSGEATATPVATSMTTPAG